MNLNKSIMTFASMPFIFVPFYVFATSIWFLLKEAFVLVSIVDWCKMVSLFYYLVVVLPFYINCIYTAKQLEFYLFEVSYVV